MKKIFVLTLMLALAFVAVQGGAFASDWECEQACYDEYLQCALGCSACDQCSCQLAYCRVSCGVPFQGC
jgi:hypothetical protein